VLAVEHRGQYTRFGVGHMAASLAACGLRIVVFDATETSDGLVRNVTEVITSLCARPIRRRSASRRAAMAVAIDRRGPEVNAEDLR
jgi:putative resolvase